MHGCNTDGLYLVIDEITGDQSDSNVEGLDGQALVSEEANVAHGLLLHHDGNHLVQTIF